MRYSRLAILIGMLTAAVWTSSPALAARVEPGPTNSGTQAVDISAAPPGYPVFGIDVSSYQGNVNWAHVAAAGAKFAYAKATEGLTYYDAYFNRNYDGARAQGLYFGAYHYARPDRSSGRAQADYFLDRARYISDGRMLPPMLDIEWPWSGSGSPYPCYGLTASQMVTWIRDFVTRVRERTGTPTMIYTNTNWWNPCTGSNASFGDNPLFIAKYDLSSPLPLPAGWSTWTLWQYSSSGSLPGDQNVFNGSLGQLERLAGPAGRATTMGDFDGDGRVDFGVWRQPEGNWYLRHASGSTLTQQWGLPGDTPLVGDVDGDGRDDFVVWRPSNGTWYVRYANTGVWFSKQWGLPADVPLMADVNGDGHDDFIVWRPATGVWWISYAVLGTTASFQWGLPGDVPRTADIGGDGLTDYLVYRMVNGYGYWYVRFGDGSAPLQAYQWGLAGDVPLAGDADGDGRDDLVVWRPSDGFWWVDYSAGGSRGTQWGLPGDVPLMADVDGNGWDDLIVWRPATGVWWIKLSGLGTNQSVQWGLNGDIPL